MEILQPVQQIQNHNQNEGDNKIMNLQLSFTKATTEKIGNDKYTLYHIDLWDDFNQEHKIVTRRYRQFYHLHHILNRYFNHVDLPTFPSKKVSINKLDPNLVKERQILLQNYMYRLQEHEQLFNSFFVTLFLELKNLKGMTCIITGASSGLGKEVASKLAHLGMHVIMACRSIERTQPIVESIIASSNNQNVEFMELDLSSLHSVRDFASKIKEKGVRIDLLVCNAACFGDMGLTKEGFEKTFGVNFLGHYLLTKILLDVLAEAPSSRIVILTDNEHQSVKHIPYDKVRMPTTVSTIMEYYQISKLALTMWALDLSKKMSNTKVTVNCVYPGSVGTRLYRNLPDVLSWIYKHITPSSEQGSIPVLYCAISKEMEDKTGLYLNDSCKETSASQLARSESAAALLCQLSEAWIIEAFSKAN